MGYGKECPRCGAMLDPGEVCECTRGRAVQSGERVDAKAAEAAERARDKEALAGFRDRVSWRLVERMNSGAAIIDALVDGEPAFRFDGYPDFDKGEWRIYPKKVLRPQYKALRLCKSVWFDSVRSTRREVI